MDCIGGFNFFLNFLEVNVDSLSFVDLWIFFL